MPRKNKYDVYQWVIKVIDSSREQDLDSMLNLIRNFRNLYELEQHSELVKGLENRLKHHYVYGI